MALGCALSGCRRSPDIDVGTLTKDGGPSDEALTSPPGFVSGTRLRARYYDLGGGAKVFVSWHDTKLNLDCDVDPDYLAPTCVPVNRASFSIAGGTWFADYTCARAVADAPSGTAPEFGVAFNRDACSEATASVMRLGAPVDPGGIYLLLDGTCRLASADQTRSRDFFLLGEPVSVTEFASFRITTENLGGRIEARVRVSDDGARQAIGGYDTTRMAASSGANIFDGWQTLLDGTWKPVEVDLWTGVTETTPFNDPSCSVPVFGVGLCGAQPTLEFRLLTQMPCFTYDGFLYEPGPPAPSNRIFRKDASGRCIQAADDGLILLEIGPSITKDALAAVTTTDVGTGRVKTRFWSEIQGKPVVLAGDTPIIDSELGPCHIVGLSDEKLHCVPTSATDFRAYRFGDDVCSQPLFVPVAPPDCDPAATMPPPNPLPLPAWVMVDTVRVGAKPSVYHVGAPYVSDSAWVDVKGTCTPLPLGPPTVDKPLFRLEKADDELPVAQAVLE